MQNKNKANKGFYFKMITSSNKKFAFRKALVLYALDYGIKPAARHFATTPKTVRKWLLRYQEGGNPALEELSRRPNTSPNKTSLEIEKLVIATRKQTPGFGAKRLVEEFELPVSHNTVHRIIRENALTGKRRKRHHKKNDLRAIKQAYEPFTRFQMDSKDLRDLPNYFAQMKTLGLPAYQYTIRELSTGAQFLAYSQELTKTYATAAVKRFLSHLKRFRLNTEKVVMKTDLGAEFDGNTRHFRPEGFHKTIQGAPFFASHRFNPPASPNFNADVESVHASIEFEFFEAERFISKPDFIRKVATYQFWYNVRRKNSSRGWKSPLEDLAKKAYHLDPRIFLLHPIFLEHYKEPSGGYHVPGLTENERKSP